MLIGHLLKMPWKRRKTARETYIVLTNQQMREFFENGVTVLDAAFPAALADRARDEIWQGLGASEHDPTSWPGSSIVDIELTPEIMDGVFSPQACAAFDQLLGKQRWRRHENFHAHPVIFPGDQMGWTVNEGGWHVDGSWFHHVLETEKQVLVILPVWSDIAADGGGTIVRRASYKVTARVLAEAGQEGLHHRELDRHVIPRVVDLPTTVVTASAGDLIIMHGFSLHTGTHNHNERTRMITNSSVHLNAPPNFSGSNAAASVFEQTITAALREPDQDSPLQATPA